MRQTATSILAFTLLTACTPHFAASPDFTRQLLSGEALFGEPVDASPIGKDEVFALNDDMRRYVAATVGDDPHSGSRLRKLIRGMIDDGLLNLDYDAGLTHTAIETFDNRQGNCLSFSILFAALAREADLDVTFQMVDLPPSYRADGGLVLLDNHINILVDDVQSGVHLTRDYVVDFNTAEYNGNYDTERVSDNYALALYFSNLGVGSLQAGNSREAFQYLKKGIETDASIAGLWVNLGVLYSRHDRVDMAEQAYRHALSIQASSKSALSNLAGLLARLDRQEEADYYTRRIAYYRERHPYYHYYRAQNAYRENDFETTLAHLARAIRLKDDEHQFYFLRGLAHYRMQQYELAARSYEKARDTAEQAQLISGYTRKLQSLESSLP